MNTYKPTKDYIKSLRTGHVLERYSDKVRVRVCKPVNSYDCRWCGKELDNEKIIKTERAHKLVSVECVSCYLAKCSNKGCETITLNIFPNDVWTKMASDHFIVNTKKNVEYDKEDDRYITLSEVIYFRSRQVINDTDFIRDLKFHIVNGMRLLNDDVQNILKQKII